MLVTRLPTPAPSICLRSQSCLPYHYVNINVSIPSDTGALLQKLTQYTRMLVFSLWWRTRRVWHQFWNLASHSIRVVAGAALSCIDIALNTALRLQLDFAPGLSVLTIVSEGICRECLDCAQYWPLDWNNPPIYAYCWHWCLLRL